MTKVRVSFTFLSRTRHELVKKLVLVTLDAVTVRLAASDTAYTPSSNVRSIFCNGSMLFWNGLFFSSLIRRANRLRTNSLWCLVVPHFCRALIAGNAVAKVDHSGDSRFYEQFHGAVDGGLAHLQVSRKHDKEKLIDIKPAVEIEELLKNYTALLAGIDPSVG